jgi:hypothetical protein
MYKIAFLPKKRTALEASFYTALFSLMIEWGLYFDLLWRETWDITEISAHRTNIEIFQEISEKQNCLINIEIDILRSIWKYHYRYVYWNSQYRTALVLGFMAIARTNRVYICYIFIPTKTQLQQSASYFPPFLLDYAIRPRLLSPSRGALHWTAPIKQQKGTLS